MTKPTSPLQIPDYRFFWISRFSSVVATNGLVVILGYQIYDIARASYGMSVKGAAFQLGLLGFFQFAPLFFLTPLAGLVADRFDRRSVAALSLVADMAVALGLAAATAAGLACRCCLRWRRCTARRGCSLVRQSMRLPPTSCPRGLLRAPLRSIRLPGRLAR